MEHHQNLAETTRTNGWLATYLAAVVLGTALAIATIAICGQHLASTGAAARLKERCAGTWCTF